MVRTSRRGRDNPGSTPGQDNLFHVLEACVKRQHAQCCAHAILLEGALNSVVACRKHLAGALVKFFGERPGDIDKRATRYRQVLEQACPKYGVHLAIVSCFPALQKIVYARRFESAQVEPTGWRSHPLAGDSLRRGTGDRSVLIH